MYRREILPVHDMRVVVGANAPPVGDTGGAVFIASGVSPVWVAQGMSDEHGQIGIMHGLVHDDPVAHCIKAEIDQVLPVFAVMIGDLVGPPEFVENLFAQKSLDFFPCVLSLQSVAADQPDIFLFDACFIKLFQDDGDGHLAVGGLLHAPFDLVRENKGYFHSLLCAFRQGRHADRIQDGGSCSLFDIL